jgi:flagellar hook-associated protein 2
VSSQITLSGFNNIDFKSVIDIMMRVERRPIDSLQTDRTTQQSKLTAYGDFTSRLGSLQSAFKALSSSSSFGSLKISSSDTSTLTASVTSSAVKGTFSINVTSLARPQVTASPASQFSDFNAPIFDAGTFSITQNGTTTPIDLAADGITSLVGLRDAINNAQDGVRAAIINDGSTTNPFRLILSSVTPGTAHAFSVMDETSMSGGTSGAVLNLATDPANGVARNTVFTYNGISIQSESTTVTGAIPGVSLNLLKEGTATISITEDDSVLKNKFTAAVDAYNSFNDFAQKQMRPPLGGATRPALYNDLVLRTASRQLKDALISSHTVAGSSLKHLAELGIQFDRNGKLTVDSSKLDEAISTRRNDVQTFLSDATSGVGNAISNLVEAYTKAGGTIDTAETRINHTIEAYDVRIAALEAQLAIRQASLTRQFTAADQAISQMNNQANALSSLGSLSW